MSPKLEKFLSYYLPYKKLLVADLVCAGIVSIIALSLPLCVRVMTESITDNNVVDALETIYTTSFIMLCLVALHALCLYFIDYKGHVMGAYIERDMRSELFSHLQKMSFSFYDNHKTGQLMTRISNDTNNLAELYHHGPEDMVITLIKFVGAFFILININVALTLTLFFCMPFMSIYAYYFGKKMKHALRETRDRIGDINARTEDSLAGIRIVASFTNELYEQDKFEIENENFLEARRKAYMSEASLYSGIVAFTQIFTIIVITVGSLSIVNTSFSIPDLITFLLYIGLLIEPIRTALNFTQLYQNGVTGFDRVYDMLQIKPAIVDAENATPLDKIHGKIEFKKVDFCYACTPKPILKALTLTVNAGEYVALVGASGIGKSTLCALIPRFYEVTAGKILIDQQNINEITLNSLRDQIAVVQQDIYLFDGTIADNIAYGKLGARLQDIERAAKFAHADTFINAMSDGYQTQIGQRGVKLSGGQRQRLSIARAFLKDPAILIFDEATSALDNESEQAIKFSLEKLSKNRTTIVIAHRLSTIQNADRILVMTEDGISEQGRDYAKFHGMQVSI